MIDRRCKNCKKSFKFKFCRLKEGRGKFCSKKCQYNFRKKSREIRRCTKCGKDKEYIPSKIKLNKTGMFFCSRKCNFSYQIGKKSSSYKHGKYTGNYYKKSSKRSDCGGNWKHRSVMESAINRKLLTYELVHHIDGDKTNNNIENLMIVTPKEHARIHGFGKNKRLRKKVIGK